MRKDVTNFDELLKSFGR